MSIFCLPRELIGEIVNALDTIDAIEFGKTNKQYGRDLSRQDFGYCVKDCVFPSTVLSTKDQHGYYRRSNVIGYFTSFYVKSLSELSQLPDQTVEIMFDNNFNQMINTTLFLSRFKQLSCLSFGTNFDQTVDNMRLLPSLTSLTFGFEYNQSVDNLNLPSTCKSLTFGYQFNQQVDNLSIPESLEFLSFGNKFNQPVDNLFLSSSLSSSLKELTFGYHFNQPVDNLMIPDSLTSLTFGFKFNQPIKNLNLPLNGSLTHLIFGSDFRQPLTDLQLPNTLTYLRFGCMYDEVMKFDKKDDKRAILAANHFRTTTS